MTPSATTRARLLALLAATFVLAACGGGAGAPPVDDQGQSAVTTERAVDGNLTDDCVESHTDGTDYFPDQVTFDHATAVSVEYTDTYKVVEVVPPDADPVTYVLLQCGAPQPTLDGDLADAQVVEVPVRSVISLTTTNLPHFAELDAADTVVGVGTSAFVATQEILDRVEAGDVKDYAGPQGQADLEKIIGAAPDLVVMDAFGDAVVEEAQRFVEAGMPTVLNADFNEQELLGRAEWLKFTALFLNAEAAATEAFDRIEADYEKIRSAAADSGEQPTVFVNTPYEGTWFVPAGNSYFAAAIADANGAYVFDDDAETYSLQLDIETVLDRAKQADHWLQAGSVNGTLADLLAIDDRFDEFEAFRKGNVWAYDKAITPGGGNAVFETAYTRADLFLADLVKILHPDAVPDHELVFFGQVPDGADG